MALVIETIQPEDGAHSVGKSTPIIFEVTDGAATVDLAATLALVRGQAVVAAGVGVNEDWLVVRSDITGGYRFELSPVATEYYRNLELVAVKVETANDITETAELLWSFTAAERAFRLSIYPFLISSVREGDE